MNAAVQALEFFEDGGVGISYVDATNVRSGMVLVTQLLVAGDTEDPAVADALAEAYSAARKLLAAAQATFGGLDAEDVDLSDGEDDDEPGYDNPLEREVVR